MTLAELKQLFVDAGCTKLYAKTLAQNDNSKNQVYFAGAVEALNAFPSRQIYAENTKKGPSFKAQLDFSWLQPSGAISPAPGAQLILYAQYPEVRFSGFLLGCKNGPSQLMADRKRAENFPARLKDQLIDRVLFLGVTQSRKVIGYLAPGNSEEAQEFRANQFPTVFVVFSEIALPRVLSGDQSREVLLHELGRIHRLGWIASRQLNRAGVFEPCRAPQCGGFTLEAELGIPKNSDSEPDFMGWEVKQFAVSDFNKIETSKPITLMTPEPDGGYYKETDVESFIRRFGYADKKGREDRLNFGGRHFVDRACKATGLTMRIQGFDPRTRKITDANGCLAIVSNTEEVAASWSFGKILEHWAKKHTRAVYVPSMRRITPDWQYSYGNLVRLAEGTDSVRLLEALADGSMYYDPGIKLEAASTVDAKSKKRSQFRIASKRLGALYKKVETVSAK